MSRPAPSYFRAALGLEAPSVIAIVGSGGKTTMLQALGQELASAGEPVILTTTTHFYPPRTGRADNPWLLGRQRPSPEEIKTRLKRGAPLVVAGNRQAGGKLSGLDPEQVSAISGYPGLWLIIEADGAARHPLKAWADWEPVVPRQCKVMMVMAGALGLGRPLDSGWVHRPELFAQATGLELGQPVNQGALASILFSEMGPLKALPPQARALLILNQLDAISPRQLSQLAQALKQANRDTAPSRRYSRILGGRLLQGKIWELIPENMEAS